MKLKKYKDLAPTALPQGAPVECVGDYYKSKTLDRLVKKLPVWDVARPTPQSLLEAARREFLEVEERLEEKRAEQKVRRKEMDAKWETLHKKEMLLRQSFISFNKFIRENQDKRDRAIRKMEEDTITMERKTLEVENMKKRVAEMEQVKIEMEKQATAYKMYETYLLEVVEAVPEFRRPIDILNRYNTLAAAKATLAARQEKDLETLENARSEMARLSEERQLVIMGLNNNLASLRWRYDKARKRVLKWELALNRLQETAAQRQTELCQIKDSIWSIYQKICKHKGMEATADRNDYESQLVVLMRALIELKRLVKVATKKAARDNASAKSIIP